MVAYFHHPLQRFSISLSVIVVAKHKEVFDGMSFIRNGIEPKRDFSATLTH